MDYFIESAPIESLQNDCIVLGVYENSHLSPSTDLLDQHIGGLISNIIERDEFEGKNGDTLLLNYIPDSNIERILIVGLGKQGALSAKDYRKILNSAIKRLKNEKIRTAACSLAEIEVNGCDWQWKTRQIVEVFEDASYQFTQTKSEDVPPVKLESVHISASANVNEQVETGLAQGKAIANGIRLAKELADLPGNICTPSYLADQAIQLSESSSRVSVSILEEADMKNLGMGALLSVTRGSRQPAKLIALEYSGGRKDAPPIALIGKGLTFDAGGISLKPGAGMDEMKYDMCGGASVLGTLTAAVEMNLPLNVVGLIPSSENLPDGDANKPGDIVTSMSGKTIEVLNTDAEGRLILCDTLTYAKKYDPEIVIDMATLTGACIIALGRSPSGLLGNNDDLCSDLTAAGEKACDRVWRLPLWEEYQDQLKSNFADMANIGGRDGGTITAACFLSRFAEDFKWAHLDIAGTAWRTGNNKGATGRPVALLTQYLLDRASA